MGLLTAADVGEFSFALFGLKLSSHAAKVGSSIMATKVKNPVLKIFKIILSS